MKLDSAILFTDNMERSVRFYGDVMGFKVDYIQDGFSSFIFPNGAKVGIKVPTKDREVPGHQTVFIATDDIEESLGEIKAKNLELYEDLSEMKGWGKYFSVLDPDGNKVLFIEHFK